MGTIIWLIGVICCIAAILDVWKKNIPTVHKLLVILILLITSWVGLLIYFFFAKDKLESWCK